MLEKLRELGIRDDLIDEIKKFRESYPAEKSYEARIPKLEQFYYGKDVWEQAITAILCGQNLLLVGHRRQERICSLRIWPEFLCARDGMCLFM